jgi:hypothetical protein
MQNVLMKKLGIVGGMNLDTEASRIIYASLRKG